MCPGDHTTLEPTSLFFLPLIDQWTQLSDVSPTLLGFLRTSYLPLSWTSPNQFAALTSPKRPTSLSPLDSVGPQFFILSYS